MWLVLVAVLSSGTAGIQNARPVDQAAVQRFVDSTPETRRQIAAELSAADATALRSALQEAALTHARQGLIPLGG
jgi:glutamine synthetase